MKWVLIIALTLLFTACGNNNEEVDPPILEPPKDLKTVGDTPPPTQKKPNEYYSGKENQSDPLSQYDPDVELVAWNEDFRSDIQLNCTKDGAETVTFIAKNYIQKQICQTPNLKNNQCWCEVILGNAIWAYANNDRLYCNRVLVTLTNGQASGGGLAHSGFENAGYTCSQSEFEEKSEEESGE